MTNLGIAALYLWWITVIEKVSHQTKRIRRKLVDRIKGLDHSGVQGLKIMGVMSV
jgi:hypothetical protein